MAQPLGDDRESPQSAAPQPGRAPLVAAKKKGCKRKKCSNWKGGKCRCGRD
ncbi:MAG: hypothetical protein VKO65_07365 [Cyanobacteriota bacterium]|nr:hypothetical protein [Cyanobacteriota bacterium]